MVLTTFVDDIIDHTKEIHVLNKKIEINQDPSKIRVYKSLIKFHKTQTQELLSKANGEGIQAICDLIDFSHQVLTKGLNKIANDPNFISRPIRYMDYE